jgi:hypothetical protein
MPSPPQPQRRPPLASRSSNANVLDLTKILEGSSLQGLTAHQLREQCKLRSMKNYASLKREELIRRLWPEAPQPEQQPQRRRRAQHRRTSIFDDVLKDEVMIALSHAVVVRRVRALEKQGEDLYKEKTKQCKAKNDMLAGLVQQGLLSLDSNDVEKETLYAFIKARSKELAAGAHCNAESGPFFITLIVTRKIYLRLVILLL